MGPRETTMLAAALLLFAANANASTEIFRCTAPGGSVTYQRVPCPTAASGGAVDIPSSFPDANALERDRVQNAQNVPAYVVVARPLRMQRHTPRRPWPIAIR